MASTDSPPSFPQVVAVGVTGLLVRFDDHMSEGGNAAALRFQSALKAHPLEQLIETAPALVSVFLRFDPLTVDLPRLEQELEQRLASQDWFSGEDAPKRIWHIPASFDGPQLRQICQLTGLSEAQIIADATQTPLRVLALGFAPGQPYLGTLPPAWQVPRQQGISPSVPAGALVTAVRQLIVFANQAPTGWWHIGNVAFRCFNENRAQPIALEPGDGLRFHAVPPAELEALHHAPDALGGARCEVTP